ncbi:MAG TPA: NAD(P)-dependent oxidoreductase [Phycisphaerae bacterium]|nr:NAD(P)-dependent oxidoreductase [Phycisphaerae bacterium]
MDVGFIGLGQMGAAMAGRLISAGHDVTVYNRTASRAEPLVQQGVRLAQRIGGACGGDVVITMLADDVATEQVVFGADGVLASLRAGAVHVSMSTISVALAERMASEHGAAGQRYVGAPVFGRPDAAAAAKLFIIAGGAADDIAACQPLFDAMGQRTLVVGGEPAQAHLVKLSGNFMIMSILEALGEAMALVGKAGIDRRRYLEILTSTLFTGPLFTKYGALLSERQFEPAGFAAILGLKDVRLALAAGEQMRVPMPMASLVRDRFLALLAQGGERLDWAAIGQLASQDAGVEKLQV